VSGRTDVTERGRAAASPGSLPRRTPGPRRAAAAGTRRAAVAAPTAGRQPRQPVTRQAGPRPATAPAVPRRRRQAAPPAAPRTAQQPQPRQRPAPQARATRFVFLVVGLLGGGLLCLLIINTILATGAFQITALQQGNVALAQREQALQAQVAAAESPGSLAHRAAALGMQVQPRLHFLDLRTGRLESQPSQLSGMPAIPAVPGYAP